MALLILLVFYNHPFDVNHVGCSQVFAINYYCYCYAALVCVCAGCCMQSSLHGLICAKTANGSGVFARTFFKYLRSLLQCKKTPSTQHVHIVSCLLVWWSNDYGSMKCSYISVYSLYSFSTVLADNVFTEGSEQLENP